MNSYNLSLFGSWYLLIFLVLVAIGLTYFTYRRTIPLIPRSKKILLFALRSLAFFIFLFVLFEPILTRISASFSKPQITVLLDNSLSLSLSDGLGSRKTAYKSVVDELISGLENSNSEFISFGANIRKLNNPTFDSLKLNNQFTDISSAIRFINSGKEENRTGAVVIVTDGVYNSGNNPIYDAEQTGKKYYLVGIGDSSEQKDISVQSIIMNEIAYVDEAVPVNVNIKAGGFSSGEVKVKIKDNGILLAEQTININLSQRDYSLLFEYLPKNEGVRKISVEASYLDGEITNKNNFNSEFINVLKNKRKIVIFAGSPNPDITYFKNALSVEKGMEIKTYIQKQGAAFFEGNPTQTALQDAELIVLIGFPISSSPNSVIDMILNEARKGKALLFIASQFLDYNKLKTLEEVLPFNTLSSKPQEFLASADFRPEAESGPLLKVSGISSALSIWNQLPPVFKTETFVKAKPESEVIASFKVNNTALKEPLILSRNFQNKKSVAIMGYGLYRWKMLGYAQEIAKGRTETKDLYTIFLKNSHRWLSLGQENKNIIIRTTKKNFSRGEAVEFFAQIYDEQYSPIDNCNVKIKISGGNEQKELTLISAGNGKYTGKLEGMLPSDYYFNGEASLNNKILGKDKGSFSVGDISIEYMDLKMNKGLLQTIAARTGGKFFNPKDIDNLLNALQNNSELKEQATSKKHEYALWNYAWLLGLAILCLAFEWFIRKRSGML